MISAISPFNQASLVLAASLFSMAAAQAPAQNASPSQPNPQPALVADASPNAMPPAAPAAYPPAPAARLGKSKLAKLAKAEQAKQPKGMRLNIERGILTVDGLACKAALNYKIDDLRYLYMYVPGSGAIIVARSPFPGATEQRDAFHDQVLTVSAAGHVAELSSKDALLSKKSSPAWVRLDPSYKLGSRYPVFGFGDSAAAPYAWPGTKPVARQHETGVAADAPPLPRSMLQTYGAGALPVAMSTTRSEATAKPATLSSTTQY